MANLNLTLDHYPLDGEMVTFKAPCNCTAITGVIFSYPGDTNEIVTTSTYSFLDSHKNTLAGLGNLFSTGAYVSGIVNHTDKALHLLNADTNGYLEDKIANSGSANSSTYTVTLVKNNWVDNGDGRYKQIVSVAGMTADMPVVIVDVALYNNNAEQNALIVEAVYQTNGSIMQQPVIQGAGTLTFYTVTVPEVSIPLYVGVVG